MKNIYVVLSATPTKIGVMIRALTKSTFNHASISFTKDLSEMYSFARYRASNPFVGGFIKEFPQRLTLGKDKDVNINVYEIPVSEVDYDKIQSFIYDIRDDKEKNIYNSLAVIGHPFGRGYNTYKAYVCTDFVIKALLSGNIPFENIMLTPGEIEVRLIEYLCYTGNLNDYSPAPENGMMVDEFFRKAPIYNEAYHTMGHFYSLVKRSLKGHHA